MLLASLSIHRLKRHRVDTVFLSKQKRTASLFTGFGALEHLVYCADHPMAGAKVRIQRMQSPGGGNSRAQIGIDVRATEGIDRLLRITDQKQSGFWIVFLDAI